MQIRDLIESATAEQYVSTLIKIFNCPFTQLVAKTIYHCCCAYVCMYFCMCVVCIYVFIICVPTPAYEQYLSKTYVQNVDVHQTSFTSLTWSKDKPY